MDVIKYKDRESGVIQEENVPGGGLLRFLYGGNPFGKLSLWVLVKRKYFSMLFGKYMDSAKSRKRIEPFIAEHQIDLSYYQVPEGGYTTFNDFFYRKVKPEARPIGEGVISPADGRVLAFENISDTQKFFVKGSEFNLEKFLGNKDIAASYVGGSMLIVRLAPVDYHRYHFPVEGIVGENIKINGAYYSVSPFALRKSLRIFCENKREYCIQKSEKNGNVLICDVGATLTGGIVQTYSLGTMVQKGTEKGYFTFGGSTLVLLFEKGKIKFSQDLLESTREGFETLLKMGETIGL